MSYTSGFFDAVDTGGGYYDRVYNAAAFAHYFSLLVKNGVFPDPSTGLQVKASNTPDMHVSVQPGNGWVNGYYITVPDNGSEVLTLPTANPSLHRIDSVIMGLNYAEREIQLYIRPGVASTNPVAVSLQRDGDVYELELAQILVSAGTASISQVNITDMRSNTSRCGIVTGTVDQIDTTGLFAQYDAAFQAWFEDIQGQLSGDVAANLQLQINALKTDKVAVSDKSSESEAVSGADDSKWMTPLKVAKRIESMKASESDALSGTNDTKWMTPYNVKKSIGNAPNTVKDLRTGKLINVRTVLDTLGIGTMSIKLTTNYGSNKVNEVFNSSGHPSLLYTNKKQLFTIKWRGTQPSSSWQYSNVLGYLNVSKTAELTPSNIFNCGENTTSSDYYSYFSAPTPISEDGSLHGMYSYSNGFRMIDLNNRYVSSVISYNNVGYTFKVGSLWGYLYQSSYNNRILYYQSVNSSQNTSYTSLNLGSGNNSSYYYIDIIGVKGSTMYFVERMSEKQYQLGRFVFSGTSTPMVTRGLYTFDISTKGWSGTDFYIHPIGFDSQYAYATVRVYNNTQQICPNVLKVSLSDGSNNWGSLDTPSPELYVALHNAYSIYPLGIVNGTLYAVSEYCLVTIASNGAIGITELSQRLTEVLSTRRFIEFNLPHLPNMVYFNGVLIDVTNGKVTPIAYNKRMELSSSNSYDYGVVKYKIQGNSGSQLGRYSSLILTGTSMSDDSFLGITDISAGTTDRDKRVYQTIDGSKQRYTVTYEEGY